VLTQKRSLQIITVFFKTEKTEVAVSVHTFAVSIRNVYSRKQQNMQAQHMLCGFSLTDLGVKAEG